jgi:hypothetical protein
VPDNIPIAICLRDNEKPYRGRQIEVSRHGFTKKSKGFRLNTHGPAGRHGA